MGKIYIRAMPHKVTLVERGKKTHIATYTTKTSFRDFPFFGLLVGLLKFPSIQRDHRKKKGENFQILTLF